MEHRDEEGADDVGEIRLGTGETPTELPEDYGITIENSALAKFQKQVEEQAERFRDVVEPIEEPFGRLHDAIEAMESSLVRPPEFLARDNGVAELLSQTERFRASVRRMKELSLAHDPLEGISEPFGKLHDSLEEMASSMVPIEFGDSLGAAYEQPDFELSDLAVEGLEEVHRAQAERDDLQRRQAEALFAVKDALVEIKEETSETRRLADRNARRSFVMQCMIFLAAAASFVVALLALSRAG